MDINFLIELGNWGFYFLVNCREILNYFVICNIFVLVCEVFLRSRIFYLDMWYLLIESLSKILIILKVSIKFFLLSVIVY